ncbi:MAG: FMN-binding protein [Bacillota bacterium]
MKKFLAVAAVIILVILGAAGAFMLRYNEMARTIETEYNKIENIDLDKIPDGTYPGKFGDFLVSVALEVTVKDHRITGIVIKKQDCGPGYEARAVVDRIIQAQSPEVDAVSGATGSSMCIMIAAGRALQGR